MENEEIRLVCKRCGTVEHISSCSNCGHPMLLRGKEKEHPDIFYYYKVRSKIVKRMGRKKIYNLKKSIRKNNKLSEREKDFLLSLL